MKEGGPEIEREVETAKRGKAQKISIGWSEEEESQRVANDGQGCKKEPEKIKRRVNKISKLMNTIEGLVGKRHHEN
jgi:hypothetical protein